MICLIVKRLLPLYAGGELGKGTDGLDGAAPESVSGVPSRV